LDPFRFFVVNFAWVFYGGWFNRGFVFFEGMSVFFWWRTCCSSH